MSATDMPRVCAISGSYFMRDPRVRREAEALADAGYQVDVICLRAPGEPPVSEHGSIHIERVPLAHERGSKFRYIFEYAAFFALASARLSVKQLKRRYDLVHIHTMPDVLVYSAWLAKLSGTPVILDIHEPMPETYQTRFGISPQHWLSRFIAQQERVSFAFADHLITIHEPMRQLFIRRSTTADKITAVMNVPDPRLFKKSASNAQSASTKSRPFTLLYTGAITFRYGLDIAVRAMALLRQTIPNARLKIVGEGDDLERVQQLASELKLGETVEFIPPVPLDQIPNIVMNSDVGVSPHRVDPVAPWYFSTKIAEYMLMGLPVISSRTETLAHYFDDSMVAYITPGSAEELAAQAQRLYQNPALGADMTLHSRKFFAEHSWEQEKAHLYKAVEALVKPERRPQRRPPPVTPEPPAPLSRPAPTVQEISSAPEEAETVLERVP